MYDPNMTLHQILLRYQIKYCGPVERVARRLAEIHRVVIENPERRTEETRTL